MTDTSTRHGMFAEALDWLNERSVRRNGAEMSPRTLEAKGYRLRSVAKMLGADSPMSLAAQLGDRERVMQLMDMLYTRQAPGTVLSTAVALRHFGEYAVAKGWIAQCAVLPEDVPSRAPRQKPITVYSEAEVERLLLYAKVKDLRFWMLLTTLADTGRRFSEVAGLAYSDFRLDAEPPHFDLATTKNKRQCYVPLSKRLVADVWTPEHIETLKAKGHPLWKKDIREYPFPWKHQAAAETLRGLCKSAEVPYHHGFHVFRHTKATALLAKGVPIQAVAALLGHNSVQTTDRIYNHATALSYVDYVD